MAATQDTVAAAAKAATREKVARLAFWSILVGRLVTDLDRPQGGDRGNDVDDRFQSVRIKCDGAGNVPGGQLQREHDKGYAGMDVYRSFEARVLETKRKLLEFLIGAKRAGKSVAGYGAPGKGNTLLNYCGIRTDFLDYTVDASPLKQGRYTPGTHIPILDPAQIRATRPDYVLILPWNLRREIAAQAQYIREWGGQFVVPIPALEVF